MGGCIGALDRRGSGVGSVFSVSSSAVSALARNRRLRHQQIKWKSDIQLTESQLLSKRDEFWDTAPAFEGKAEIWAALKAAAEAVGREDYDLAQALLDGAGVSLPGGSLVECYDELGTRYAIPVYCLSFPLNLDTEADRDSPAEFSEPVVLSDEQEIKVKVRVSLSGEDVRLLLNTTDTVAQAKLKLQELVQLPEHCRQRWYFGGKLLGDKMRMGDCNVPSGYVIQCIVNPLQFDVIEA